VAGADGAPNRVDERVGLADIVGDRNKGHAARPRRTLQPGDVLRARDDDVGPQRPDHGDRLIE
jgi:hypothetical protein